MGVKLRPEKTEMAGKRHASAEIAAKLAQANELAVKGKTHREISKALGVSVMTYHRWKKMMSVEDGAGRPANMIPQTRSENASSAEIDERLKRLERENTRLRWLVTDMLLEMLKGDDELPARQQAPFERPDRLK
jgi:transposase